jgi:hypothetical protein
MVSLFIKRSGIAIRATHLRIRPDKRAREPVRMFNGCGRSAASLRCEEGVVVIPDRKRADGFIVRIKGTLFERERLFILA